MTLTLRLVALLGTAATHVHAQQQEATAPTATAETAPATTAETSVPAAGSVSVDEENKHMIVTAARRREAASRSPASVTVISAEEIEHSKVHNIVEVLRRVPGLDVVETGANGIPSVFMRGMEGRHVLWMIDGVRMGDPSSTGGEAGLSGLSLNNVERIEIVRGPASSLYGSDAIAGVINIITKKGAGQPHGSLTLEGGSRDTYTEKGEFAGGDKLFHYALGLSRQDSKGFSSASAADGNKEKDAYGQHDMSLHLGTSPQEFLDYDFFLRTHQDRTDLDASGGAGGDDPNYYVNVKSLFTRNQLKLRGWDNRYEQTLGFNYANIDRDFYNPTDPSHPVDRLRSSFYSETYKLDWQHDLVLADWNTLTFGAEAQREEAGGRTHSVSDSPFGPFEYNEINERATVDSRAVFLQDEIHLGERLTLTAGGRLDDHELFGTHATWRLGARYALKETDTVFKANVGTGFKAPSLYQLHSIYGNPDLQPEESQSYDAGFEQGLVDNRVVFGATYFHNKIDELIDFASLPTPPFGRYENVSRAETKGVETMLKVTPVDDLTLRATYTYTHARNLETGDNLLRRPRHKYGLGANYQWDKTNFDLSYTRTGTTEDLEFDPTTFASSRVHLHPYNLVNFAVTHQVNEHFQIFGRVENILDEDYTRVVGYGEPGIGFFAGLRLNF